MAEGGQEGHTATELVHRYEPTIRRVGRDTDRMAAPPIGGTDARAPGSGEVFVTAGASAAIELVSTLLTRPGRRRRGLADVPPRAAHLRRSRRRTGRRTRRRRRYRPARYSRAAAQPWLSWTMSNSSRRRRSTPSTRAENVSGSGNAPVHIVSHSRTSTAEVNSASRGVRNGSGSRYRSRFGTPVNRMPVSSVGYGGPGPARTC